MERIDFWYNAEAGRLGAIPTGTRAGQFLFLSTQTPINIETGRVIRDLIDLPQKLSNKLLGPGQHLASAIYGPIIAQTWTVFDNLSKILAKQGASLEDLVCQRIFLRDIRDVRWMEQVMLSFFHDELPSTLILGAAEKGLHPDVRVWVDVIALSPEKNGLRKEAIYLKELEKVTAPYPQAVKVGQFLFFNGLVGIDPENGLPVTSFNDVAPEAKSGKKGQFIDAAFEATKSQYWLCHEHIKRLLRSQGAAITDLVQTYTFRRHGMRIFAETDYIRQKLYKSVEASPTSEGFGTYNLSIIPDVEIITGGVALLPGEHKKVPFKCDPNKRVGTFASLVKAGPLWFTAGNSNILEKQQHVVDFGDITDEGHFLAQGRSDCGQLTMAKAWYIYKFLLDEVDARQAVMQTVYMTDAAEWPAVERVASIIFKGHIPPTTVIPVDEISFYWQSHMRVPPSIGGHTLEIGMWGLDT